MIKTILIDDEPLARTLLKEYLKDFPRIEIVQECGDGFEGLKAILQHRPQLIFLDIQMPKISGFEMLELIEHPPAVIFVTAFDEYAIKAFELHAVDYLLKPFSRERFHKAVEKITDAPAGLQPVDPLLSSVLSSSPQNQRVVVKTSGNIKIIPLEDIHYLEAADDYVRIYTQEGSFLKKRTMAHFETQLDPSRFIRIHRSYIINIQQITRIDPYEKENHLAILKNGNRIPVSKAGFVKLRAVLGL